MARPLIAIVCVMVLAGSACGDPPLSDLPSAALQVTRGQAAFARECATCHASGDGIDLVYFNFSDTTIIRRALGHVDEATAHDIVAYIHTLGITRARRDLRLFQPRGEVLSGDLPFARQLFGEDAWPAGYTAEQLRAVDLLRLPTAVPFPLWSVETGNLDWMPDDTLPTAILEDRGGLARRALSSYRANATDANLVNAVQALRNAERRVANPDAPCLLDSLDRVNFNQCFQVRRWASVLGAQHMIRSDRTGRLSRAVHDVWWEVGNVARKAIAARASFPNAERVWAEWMYLGWIFEPASFASTYTGNGLLRLGLPRHATFVALRSLLERPRQSPAPYADVESAAKFAPSHWAFGAVRFGLTQVLERQRSGDLPATVEHRAEAVMKIESAYLAASRKVTAAQAMELRALADQVLAPF